MVEQVRNQRVARKQADFVADQIKKQISRGGRVLLEHPWTSDLWKYGPIAKLIQQNKLQLCRADMCAYELRHPDTHVPVQKPTGLAVSHSDMTELALGCPGHAEHSVIAGRCKDGENLSSKVAAYTPCFVRTWLSCIHDGSHLCHFSCLQETSSEPSEPNPVLIKECLAAAQEEGILEDQPVGEDQEGEDKDLERRINITLRKLRNNLGHPSSRSLHRILKNAGAKAEVLRLVDKIEQECPICTQRRRPT